MVTENEIGNDTHVGFPPEFVNPDDKEKAAYGLQYAKAIYTCGTRYGLRYFNADTANFNALTEQAQGEESVTLLRNLFGYASLPNNQKDVTADLAHLDVGILKLAPKYINRAVAKMQKLQYDIGLQAIDVVSVDEKAAYAAAIQAFYRQRKWIEDMGYDPQVFFPDIDISSLPLYPDEMLFDIATNPKIKKEIGGELLIKLLHSINNFNQKMREVDWDLAVYGLGHVHCYADANGIPREDRINPKFWGGSYVENDNFEDQEYAFFFEFISHNQFIKETSDQLTQDQQMEIVRAYSNKNSAAGYLDYRRSEHFDGLGYLPVMRYYFRSEDNRTFVTKKNEFGREYILEKGEYLHPEW